MIAERLVNELMLVSVLVAGEGAAGFAATLEAAGAAAEVLGEAAPLPGYDLAILLAAPESAADAAIAARVATLAGASDRLLFAPLPLREGPDGPSPGLLSLNAWFEVFAEHGYQPVVDFDADFVAAGAFLVDREATAAEGELAAFADRLQNPAASAKSAPLPHDDGADQAERDSLRAEIAALHAQIASLTEAAALAEAQAQAQEQAQAPDSAWDALAPWVCGVVADPSRNTLDALRRDLPRLQELRGTDAPILVLPDFSPPLAPLSWQTRLRTLFRPAPAAAPLPAPAILDDSALVRASKLFDPAWYIASTPELLAGEALDPVFHYLLVGALRGADPGPYFDSAAYVAAHPQASAPGICPLLHAIRSGEA